MTWVVIMNTDDLILISFGNHLKKLREERSLSQEELAHRASLDRTYISGVENGRRNISLKALNSVAKAMEINLAELFEDIKYDKTRP